MTALKVAKKRLDDRLKPGKGSVRNKLADYYSKNAGALNNGLNQMRARDMGIKGSGVTASTPLFDLFAKDVEGKMSQGMSLRKALDKTLKTEVFRGAMGTDNYLGAWKASMGAPKQLKNGNKMAGMSAASADWEKFKKESGWKENQATYENLEWDDTVGGLIFTNAKGEKWQLLFDDSPKQAYYNKL